MDKSTGGWMAHAQEALPEAWRDFLGPDLGGVLDGVLGRLALEPTYYPRGAVFRAFELCPPDNVKVVVMGQDPYHGEGEANGLAFSVGAGIRPPPSLRNIYKELLADIGTAPNSGSGDLSGWAREGVLLLNSMLTVRPNLPASHVGLGWQLWTDGVLAKIGSARPDTVFVLWGGKAKEKLSALPKSALVVAGGHPSPLSANRGGFFGGKYFSQSNLLLESRGHKPIDWAGSLVPGQLSLS